MTGCARSSVYILEFRSVGLVPDKSLRKRITFVQIGTFENPVVGKPNRVTRSFVTLRRVPVPAPARKLTPVI